MLADIYMIFKILLTNVVKPGLRFFAIRNVIRVHAGPSCHKVDFVWRGSILLKVS